MKRKAMKKRFFECRKKCEKMGEKMVSSVSFRLLDGGKKGKSRNGMWKKAIGRKKEIEMMKKVEETRRRVRKYEKRKSLKGCIREMRSAKKRKR